MLALAIAFGALFVVIDSLCAYLDARDGITGVYELPADSIHRRSTCAPCVEDTRRAA